MKPYLRVLVLLSAAVAVAAACHVFCHRLGCGKRACGPAREQAAWHNADWLAAKLGMTPEQKAKLAPMNAEYAATLEAACAEHRRLHAQLNEALFDAGAPAEKAGGLLEEMSRARLAADQATLRHIRAVSALLTPEQRKAFRELFECRCEGGKKP